MAWKGYLPYTNCTSCIVSVQQLNVHVFRVASCSPERISLCMRILESRRLVLIRPTLEIESKTSTPYCLGAESSLVMMPRIQLDLRELCQWTQVRGEDFCYLRINFTLWPP